MRGQRQVNPAPGQVGAFFEDEIPETFLPPGATRPEAQWRAGTVLDHHWTHQITGSGKRGKLVHGLYDESQRVYQTGGEMSHFIFWKRKLVTFNKEAWDQVWQRADWIEVIDHEKNVCWRIATGKATKHAIVYDAGIGQRVGVPMELFDVVRANGSYEQRGHG